MASVPRETSVVRGKLTTRFINSVTRPGKYHDRSSLGLYLHVRTKGSKQYVQRLVINGRRKEIGLGPHPAVTLYEARNLALENKRKALAGHDPAGLKAKQKEVPTFAEAVERTAKSIENKFSERYMRGFRNSLKLHVTPVLGHLQVNKIDNTDLVSLINKVSAEKPATAKSLKARISKVFNYCVSMGYVKNNLVEISRGAFDSLDVKVTPRVSLSYNKCHDFIKKLHDSDGYIGVKLILEFIILTAKRSGETRTAEWKEIDFESCIWNIPKEHTKDRKPHTVPLSKRAIEILQEMRGVYDVNDDDHVIFRSEKNSGVIDRATLTDYIKDVLKYDVHLHGFRTSFRTWAQEETDFSDEACEIILGHKYGNSVRSAYARSPLLEERYHILSAWANFLSQSPDKYEHKTVFQLPAGFQKHVTRIKNKNR